jgi:Tol biopolymer transport system component
MADDNLLQSETPRPTGRPVYESTLLPNRRRRRFSPWLVVPGLLILLLAVFYFLVFGPKPRRFVATAGSVAFASDLNSPGVTHLWTMNADGSAPRQLTTGLSADLNPIFTADGSQIAFLSNRGGGPNQIWLMDSDGKNLVQVTRTSGAKAHPMFAPGSNGLLGYLSGPSLAVQSVGKGDAALLLPPPGAVVRPDSTDPSQTQDTASADGAAVAFAWKPLPAQANSSQSDFGLAAVLETAGVQTLAVLPTLASAPRLTQNDQPNGPPLAAADRLSPAWAPDGSHMAVALLHVQGLPAGQKASGLIQFDSLGMAVKPLLPLLRDPAVGPQNPVYSPDGSQIVFEMWRQADLANRIVLGLFIVDADGSGTPHLLAKGDSGDAQFSLDGKQVFFLRRRPDSSQDLCRVNADGTGLVRLSDGHSNIPSFALSPQTAAP